MPDIPERDVSRNIPDRGREREYFEISNDEANRKSAEWLAKLSVLGTGAHILGKKYNINFIAEMIDLAGDGARFLGGLSKSNRPTGLRPEVANIMQLGLDVSVDGGGAVLKRRFGGARLDEIDSIRSIMDSIGVISDPKNFRNRAGMEDAFKTYFANMPRRAGNATEAFFHHDLDRMTFGDLLDHNHTWIDRMTKNVIPGKEPLELASINKALDLGWITRDTIVDPKLFTSKGTRRSKRVLDTRLMSPGFAVNQLSRIVDIAGIVKSSSAMFGAETSVAMIGPAVKGGLNRLFIGGDIFDITPAGPLKKVASGMRLGRTGDILYTPSRLREAQQKGMLKSLYADPESSSLYSRLQHKIGIGTEFQERPGGLVQTSIRALRQMRAVGKGDAAIVAREYKYQQNSTFNMVFGDEITHVDDVFSDSALGLGASKAKFSELAGKDVISKLNLRDKIKAYLGINEDVSIVKSAAVGKTVLSKDDFYLPFRRAGLSSLEQPIGKSTKAVGVSMSGAPSYTVRPEFYASSGSIIDKTYDFGNYLSIRLNALASSSLLGIGFRPSGNLLGNVTRLAAIPAIYMTGMETAKYLGYKTGLDETLADAYTGSRVLQQTIREYSGISGFANFFEQLFPGMSFGAIGTGVAGAAGIARLSRTGSYGSALGLASAIYGAVGGPNVGQSPDELRRVYTGEEKVPVRRAAWWAMGYQPFWGGDITHYAPSWYVRMKQQPYKTNVYGSEQNYWERGTFIPTLENLFHLKTIADPYWLERQNYNRRPYPVTTPLGEEIPIFGPLVADTVGSILKPRRYMHEEDTSNMLAVANVTNRGVPANAAARLGIPDIPLASVEMNRPDIVQDRLEKYANVALEPTGIWKFALGYFGIKFDENYKLAESGVMGSATRGYYSAGLGGLLGESEFIRRFLLSEYGRESKINQMVNPIRNEMPSWLPGSGSEFAKDRTYFRDFHLGDAYSKLPGGEFRLPGKGYEAVNPLHGKDHNDHELFSYRARVQRVVDADTVDVLIGGSAQRIRFANLRAPESDTYEGQVAKAFLQEKLQPGQDVIVKTGSDLINTSRQTGAFGRSLGTIHASGQNISHSLVAAGLAHREDSAYDAVDRMLILSDVAPFSQAYFAAKREVDKMKLTAEWQERVQTAEENRLKKLDKYGFTYGAAGSQEALATANWNPALKAIRNSYMTFNERFLSEIPLVGTKLAPKKDPLEHYVKFQVEGETFADWNRAYDTIVRPAIYDVANEDPFTASLKGGILAGLGTGAFVRMGAFLNPIQMLANPLSGKYMIASGALIGGGASAARMVSTGNIRGGLIPLHVEEERRVEEYFDKLEYAKYNSLADMAASRGDYELAGTFNQKARKTTTYGLDVLRQTGSVEQYRRSLGGVERTYFESFLNAPESKRSSILSVVPAHMQEALRAAYNMDNSSVPMQEEVQQYFAEHGMPSGKWIGWHPEVPDEVIQIKTLEGGIGNFADTAQDYNFYPSQIREASVRFPFVTPAFPTVYPDDGMAWLSDIMKNSRGFSIGAGPRTSTMTIDITDKRRDNDFFYMFDLGR